MAAENELVRQIPKSGYPKVTTPGAPVDSTELSRNVGNTLMAVPGMGPTLGAVRTLAGLTRAGQAASAVGGTAATVGGQVGPYGVPLGGIAALMAAAAPPSAPATTGTTMTVAQKPGQAEGTLQAVPAAMAAPANPMVLPAGANNAQLAGYLPQPGQGAVRNNATGRVTFLDTPPPTNPAASTMATMPMAAPARQQVQIPRLAQRGGLFNAMADLTGQVSSAAGTVVANRAANAQRKEGTAVDQLARTNAREDMKLGVDVQRNQIADRGASVREAEEQRKAKTENFKAVDVTTGTDPITGQPIKTTMLVDLSKLGPDGKPVAMQLQPGGQSAAPKPLPPKDKLVSGQVYDTPRGRAKWDGKQFIPA